MSHKIVKFQVFLNVSNVPISRQSVSHIYGKFQENDHAPFLIITFLEVNVREEEICSICFIGFGGFGLWRLMQKKVPKDSFQI